MTRMTTDALKELENENVAWDFRYGKAKPIFRKASDRSRTCVNPTGKPGNQRHFYFQLDSPAAVAAVSQILSNSNYPKKVGPASKVALIKEAAPIIEYRH